MSKAPVDTLMEISMGHTLPRCLHVVAQLGIADALEDTPRSAGELASATGTHAGALGRVLRLLAAHGVFQQCDGKYSHTPASRLLRSDHPQSMRSFVRMIGFPVYWSMFEFLDHSVRTRIIPKKVEFSMKR